MSPTYTSGGVLLWASGDASDFLALSIISRLDETPLM